MKNRVMGLMLVLAAAFAAGGCGMTATTNQYISNFMDQAA
jgi:hypothetical protein